MSLFNEKRNHSDRRVRNDGPPPGSRERRSKKDRRQTSISEISFHEWTLHLLKFRKRIEAKAARRAAARALAQSAEPTENPGQDDTP